MLFAGRRTQYNALKNRPSSWDPYGVAKVNMSEFMLGQKVLNLQIPVHSCTIPDILGRETEAGRVRGTVGLQLVLTYNYNLKINPLLFLLEVLKFWFGLEV